ncbi:hypothetical protein [Actinoplanes sp. NPDC026619]|uniref:hypothetical protein n=1 Tax=Actinoplanes sp. NPDC026619 TaxID=3155798 RepID=UPI0033CD92AF
MLWAIIDESLSTFTADSVLPVVAAAMDAPGAAAWTSHLAALWLRVLRRPPRGATIATANHAAQLADAAVRAVSGRPVLASRPPNDPRENVGFSLGDRRFRIHPGDHEHPLMTLRALAATAQAVDDDVLAAFGFTFSDVLDVVLAHGHRTLTQLAGQWTPAHRTGSDLLQPPLVDAAQVAVVAAVQAASNTGLSTVCRNPQRAAAALQWLTRDARKVQARPSAFAAPLGPVLFVRTADRAVGVPACLTLDVLSAAGEALVRRIGKRPAAVQRMQALTMAHAHALYSKKVVDRSADLPLSEAPLIIGPRTVTTVGSGLTQPGLSHALDQAAARLREHVGPTDPAPGNAAPAKVMVFGAPPVTPHTGLHEAARANRQLDTGPPSIPPPAIAEPLPPAAATLHARVRRTDVKGGATTKIPITLARGLVAEVEQLQNEVAQLAARINDAASRVVDQPRGDAQPVGRWQQETSSRLDPDATRSSRDQLQADPGHPEIA